MDVIRNQVMLWDLADCHQQPAALAAAGVRAVAVKCGGDGGSTRYLAQWSARALAAWIAAGIQPQAWSFVLRDYRADLAELGRALAQQDTDTVILNCEIGEGGWDNATSADVAAFLADARAAVGGRRLGFSSCPSWDGDPARGAPAFPYEAFCEGCEFSMPQQYWTGAPDQVSYEFRRNRTGKPVIPILWGSWDTATLTAQAEHCRLVLGAQLAGLSSWGLGSAAVDSLYNAAGMLAAYGVVMDERTQLLNDANAIPLFARGNLAREGIVDLTAAGGGQAERIALYDKQYFHRLNGTTQTFFRDPHSPVSYAALHAAGKITLYGDGEDIAQ